MELYQRVDEALHYLWEPIRVAGSAYARDEYYSYVPRVFALLRAGAEAREIADHLDHIVQERMGLPPNTERSLQVAELLLDWKRIIERRA
jgi:hypothetical protein